MYRQKQNEYVIVIGWLTLILLLSLLICVGTCTSGIGTENTSGIPAVNEDAFVLVLRQFVGLEEKQMSRDKTLLIISTSQ